ncbi:MAG: metallophosphoesterase [Candidatus Krumholzibacteria bacterium]|nr:metallophosphoesterase [Candidatus Krumholzibacteria bacterium]
MLELALLAAAATAAAATGILCGPPRGGAGEQYVTVDYVAPASVGTVALELFDLRGRRLARAEGSGDIALHCPAHLPAGVFILRLSAPGAAPANRRFTSVGHRVRTVVAKRVGLHEITADPLVAMAGDHRPRVERIAASRLPAVGRGDSQDSQVEYLFDRDERPQSPPGMPPACCPIYADPIRFMVYGDTHAGYEPAQGIHWALIYQALSFTPELILHLGDLIHGQTDDAQPHWEQFDRMAGVLVGGSEFYPTVGNHEVRLDFITLYFDYFHYLPNADQSLAYYVIEKPYAIFVVLDVDAYDASTNYTPEAELAAFLEQTLQQFAHKTYKFVTFHIPGYTGGIRGRANWARVFDPLFVEYGVDIVFNGHTHAYERFVIDGVNYIVSGGGGGVPHPLGDDNFGSNYPFGSRICCAEANHYVTVAGNEESLRIQACYLSGEVFDSFEITGR